jgi:hypothetical protein
LHSITSRYELVSCGISIKAIILITGIFITNFSLKAQSSDSLSNLYIESYKELLSIKSNINNDIERFEVRVPGSRLDLRPNTSLVNSYTLSHKFIVFTFSFNPSFININNDEDLRGETKVIRYQTNLALGEHFNQYLSFQKVRGYYLNNTSDFDPSWQEGQPYIQFPKLNYLSWHGVTTYQLNPNFAYFASIAPNQRQARSAGSLLFDLSYNYYIIDDRTALTGTNSSQRSQNLELLPSVGYGYTFVVDRFYTMLRIKLGVGKIHTKLITRSPGGTVENNDWANIIQGAGTAAIGYDNGRFFTGGEFNLMRSKYNQEAQGAAVFNNHTFFEVFVGYRFDPPNFLKSLKLRS